MPGSNLDTAPVPLYGSVLAPDSNLSKLPDFELVHGPGSNLAERTCFGSMNIQVRYLIPLLATQFWGCGSSCIVVVFEPTGQHLVVLGSGST